ncbi:MAG TPA: glycosyltransferase [Solirubrobacteraceae bacterium]|jgi:hypothetical protein|nr:glycosyltransferase [Solirubrobacteraceae bacterium]
MALVLFHRNFQKLQGGHLKVFHYFEHVRSSPAHEARIRFTPDTVWDRSNPWHSVPEAVLGEGEQPRADVQFLAGNDWRRLEPGARTDSPVPILNLIQYMPRMRHVGALNQFLVHPAIRICVSPEIQEVLERAGTVPGPIFTIPIGLDLELLPQPRPAERRDLDCVVLAIKDVPAGRKVAARLRKAGHRVMLVDEPIPREQLLAAMARARVTVHLPALVEGAYLPALESMALGAAVVCPDCVGNRSFCRDGETCLVPERNERAIAKAALTLLAASPSELEPMLAGAREEALRRTLALERTRFLELVDRVEELWAAC